MKAAVANFIIVIYPFDKIFNVVVLSPAGSPSGIRSMQYFFQILHADFITAVKNPGLGLMGLQPDFDRFW
jgi:hypothetical protein